MRAVAACSGSRTYRLSFTKSSEILNRSKQFIPGGIASTNRATDPPLVFRRAEGAYLWDADGNKFIDYHAAFAPHILGHNDPRVTEAVERVLRDKESLYGSGATVLETRLAGLTSEAVPAIDSIERLNTGSEATYQALRLARAGQLWGLGRELPSFQSPSRRGINYFAV